MSQPTVIGTIKACILDAQFGLAARLESVVDDLIEDVRLAPDEVQREFQFSDARTQALVQPASITSVSVRAVKWDASHRNGNLRDAAIDVEVRVENFIADERIAKGNADLYAEALARMLDELREFSDQQSPNGPVIDVLAVDDVMLSVLSGQFDNPVSTGFLATFRVQERTIYV